MKKVTYTLDDETVARLDRMAKRFSRPKSQIVRESIRCYAEKMDRLSEEERDRMLRLFDDVTTRIPERPRAEIEEELEAVRNARRSGGRRTRPEKSR